AILAMVELVEHYPRRGLAEGLRAAGTLALRYGTVAPVWLFACLLMPEIKLFPGHEPAAFGGFGQRAWEYVHQLRWQLGPAVVALLAIVGLVLSLTNRRARR